VAEPVVKSCRALRVRQANVRGRPVGTVAGPESRAMPPWVRSPAYSVDLDRPLRERFDVFDADIIRRGRELLDGVREEIPRRALRLATPVDARTGFRFGREARAIARIAGVDWRWVMIANISYDLALASMACSTAALATPDGPVVARNMDWWPEQRLAAASCTLEHTRGGRASYVIAGWPGSMGVVTGLSARGFALVINAVLCEEAPRLTGYPVLLLLRRVLAEATGFDDAVKRLSRARLIAAALITVVGTANDQRVCIERTPTRSALRRADGDRALVTTNGYVALDELGRQPRSIESEELFESTCRRFENLRRLAADIAPARRGETDAVLGVLTHEGVMQEITAQHVIMQPATGRMELYVPRRLVEAGSRVG